MIRVIIVKNRGRQNKLLSNCRLPLLKRFRGMSDCLEQELTLKQPLKHGDTNQIIYVSLSPEQKVKLTHGKLKIGSIILLFEICLSAVVMFHIFALFLVCNRSHGSGRYY